MNAQARIHEASQSSSVSSHGSFPQPTPSTLDMTEFKSNPSGGPSTFDTPNPQHNMNVSPSQSTQGPTAPFPSIPSTIPSTLSTLPMTEPLSASRQAARGSILSIMSTAPTIRQAGSEWGTPPIVQRTPEMGDEEDETETQTMNEPRVTARKEIEEDEQEVVFETQPETSSSRISTPHTPIDDDIVDDDSPPVGTSNVAPIPQIPSSQFMFVPHPHAHIATPSSQFVPSTQPDDFGFIGDDDDIDPEDSFPLVSDVGRKSSVSTDAASAYSTPSKPPNEGTTAGDSQVRHLSGSEGSLTLSSGSGNKQGSQDEEASQSPTRARSRRRGSGLVIAEEEEGEEGEKGRGQESEKENIIKGKPSTMAQTSTTAPTEEELVGVATIKGQIEPSAVTEKGGEEVVVLGEEEQMTMSEPSAKAKGKKKETAKVAKGRWKGKERVQETDVEVEAEEEEMVEESQLEESYTKAGLAMEPAATETKAEVSAVAGPRKQTKIKAGERQVVLEASTKIPMKKRAMKLQKDSSEKKAAEKIGEDEKVVEHETGPPEEEKTDEGEETPTAAPLTSKNASKAAAPPKRAGESRSQKGKGKEKEAEKISESAGSSEGEKTDEGEKTPTPASSTRKRSGKSAPLRKHEGKPKETGSGDEEDETQKVQEDEPSTTEVPVPKKGRGTSKKIKFAGKSRKIKASEMIEEGMVEPEAAVTKGKDAAVKEQAEVVEEQAEAKEQAETIEEQAETVEKQAEVVEEQAEAVELEAAEVGLLRPRAHSEKGLSVKAGGHPIKRKVRRIATEEDEGSESEEAGLKAAETDLEETENEEVVVAPKVPRNEKKRAADAEDEESAALKPAEVSTNVQGEEAGIEEADPSRLVTRTAPKKIKPRKGTKPTEIETAETEPAETEPAETEPAETEPAETKPAETKAGEPKKGSKKALKGKGKKAVAASKTTAGAKKQRAVDEREKDEDEVAGTDGDTEGGEDEEGDVPETVGSKGKRGSRKELVQAAKGEKSAKGKKPQRIATGEEETEDKLPKSTQAEASGASLRRSTRTLAKPPPSTKPKPVTKSRGTAIRQTKKTTVASEDEHESDELAKPPPPTATRRTKKTVVVSGDEHEDNELANLPPPSTTPRPITKSKGTTTRRAKKTAIASEDEQENDELANSPLMATPKLVKKSKNAATLSAKKTVASEDEPKSDEEPFKQFYETQAKLPKVKVTYKSPGKRRTIAASTLSSPPLPQVSSSSGRAVESSQGSERLSEGSEESEPTSQPKKNKGKQKETVAKKQDKGEGDKAVGKKRKESPVTGSLRSKREKPAIRSDEDEERDKETVHTTAARGVNKGRSVSAKEKGKGKADVKRKQIETEVEEETAESDKQKAGPSTRKPTKKPLKKPAKRAKSESPPDVGQSGPPGSSVKVLFSSQETAKGRIARNLAGKVVERLAGRVVERWQECTHLVSDNIRKSVSFLCALSAGRKIMSMSWIDASEKAGEFVAETNYILRDEVAEKEYRFSLADSLERTTNPSHPKLLAGMKFYMPESSDGWKEIIETAGGMLLKRRPTNDEKDVLIFAKDNSERLLGPFNEAGFQVVSKDDITLSILRQELSIPRLRLEAA